MDSSIATAINPSEKSEGKETTTVTKRVEHSDGSYDEVRVEEVEGGFIQYTTRHFKDAKGDWQWKDSKSVHTENPLEKKSLVDKLSEVFNM